MHSTTKVRWAILVLTVLFSGIAVLASETDDYIPEVTDRVARISFVQGDVQIKRANSQDWEVVVMNLPIVEGDEIATDADGRFEIQFNSYTHLRAGQNTQVNILRLKDEGIAISVPLGTVSLRTTEFNSGRSYFEIDAPKTTISVQRAGVYRVESGVPDSLEVFVSATEGGEARVYTSDAGFTIKNGRRAKIFVAGNQTGEWETVAASRFIDEFDEWSIERDAIIARRLRDAHYDRYYDRDIYGAEDLNDHGDWVHTQKYGYVWRPYRNSISQYADWSPYRYGHWRWVPPYGWTWVNDEAWGWATYHHGRWVWDNGTWYWTPYGYYRNRRSWWQPALVVVQVINNNVCWYPLPYRYGYYDYNSHYSRRRRHNGNNGPGGPVAGNPTPAPGPGAPIITPIRGGRDRVNEPPLSQVPPGGVITVPASEFGRGKGNLGRPPRTVAQAMLSKPPDDGQSPPILPTYGDLNGKVSREIRVARPSMVRTPTDVPTGVTPRRSDAPLDQELQRSRILGGRPPLLQVIPSPSSTTAEPGEGGPRRTGAVQRPVRQDRDDATPVRQAPPPKQDSPVYSPPIKQEDEPAPAEQPRYNRPQRRVVRDEPEPTPRYDPPPKREDPPPRYDPPPKREDPPPRNDPTPRNDPPPPKSDPPPTKSEPTKPDSDGKLKDGRFR